MLVYNPTTQKHNVRVYGSHFEFTPGQVKSMSPHVGAFLTMQRAYMGFVELPDICVEDPNSQEAKTAKENAKKLGIKRRVEYLTSIVRNEEISLRQDLDKNNDASATDSHTNEGLIAQYRELAGYRAVQNDEQKKNAEELAKLREQIKAH